MRQRLLILLVATLMAAAPVTKIAASCESDLCEFWDTWCLRENECPDVTRWCTSAIGVCTSATATTTQANAAFALSREMQQTC